MEWYSRGLKPQQKHSAVIVPYSWVTVASESRCSPCSPPCCRVSPGPAQEHAGSHGLEPAASFQPPLVVQVHALGWAAAALAHAGLGGSGRQDTQLAVLTKCVYQLTCLMDTVFAENLQTERGWYLCFVHAGEFWGAGGWGIELRGLVPPSFGFFSQESSCFFFIFEKNFCAVFSGKNKTNRCKKKLEWIPFAVLSFIYGENFGIWNLDYNLSGHTFKQK